MTSFGLMQTSFLHEKNYMLELARAGSSMGFTVFRFQPQRQVGSFFQGLQYDSFTDDWKKSTFKTPRFIYDRCFHNAPTKKTLTIIKELKENPHTTFLGYGLPGKWNVYNKLKTDSTLHLHLPVTYLLNHRNGFKMIQQLLKEKPELLLKPLIGSQGNGLVYIKVQEGRFHLQINHKGELLQHTYDTTSSFHHFIQSLLTKRRYLAQEMLNLRDQHNNPFDRRVVMKKQADNWKELGRATRVGMPHSFVSNLHSGGVIKPLNVLGLNSERFESDEKISELSLRTARLVEQHFPPKFELGLDFGIDQTGHVWLLEANSKPGHSIIQHKHDLHILPFQYCRYLQSQKKGVTE